MDINRGQSEILRAGVGSRPGARRGRSDKQHGDGVVHTVIHPFWPASLGFANNKVSAVVERKSVRLAAKQTVVRREEQLSARQARIGKGRQGRVAVENVLLIREKFTGRLSGQFQWLQAVCRCLPPPTTCWTGCLPASETGSAKNKQVPAKIDGNQGP